MSAGGLADLSLPPGSASGAEQPAELLSAGLDTTGDAVDAKMLLTGNALPETGNNWPLTADTQDVGNPGDVENQGPDPKPGPLTDGATVSGTGTTNIAPSMPGMPNGSLPSAGLDAAQAAAELPEAAELPLPPSDKGRVKVAVPADESAPEAELTGSALDDETAGPRPAQRAFETAMARTEPLPGARTATIAAFAAAGGESGQTGWAPVAGQSPGVTPALIETASQLPQFQAMRPLQPTVDPQGFLAGLGQRLTVMSGQGGVQSARLQLHPENLGSLDVRIQIEEDTARVWFNTQHGQTREILESALPKLRDLFAQQGMALLEADVGSGDDRQRTSNAFDGADAPYPGATAGGEPAGGPEQSIPTIIRPISDRVLDVYA